MDNTKRNGLESALACILNNGERRGEKEEEEEERRRWRTRRSSIRDRKKAKKGNGWRYTALKTSNKINVVSGDSIRKTHRTISHTILRQNGQDSYLLHGRPFPPSYNRLPSYPRFPSRTSLVFFILNPRESAATRSFPLTWTSQEPFPFRAEQIVARLITARERSTGRKRSAVSIALTRFRYANQTFLYREPRINYSLDTYTGILYSIIGA